MTLSQAMTPGTPDWWLDRLYKRLRYRDQTYLCGWEDWYSGNHPAPSGYEKAGPMLVRLLDTVGLNILATVTDAALDLMHVEGFKINGEISDDVWEFWQRSNFDLGSEMCFQEKMALSESYGLVDPNKGEPILTPEHPSQAIVEYVPGSRVRAAGLKVWVDDISGPKAMLHAMVYLPDSVHLYSAPTRVYSPQDPQNRTALAMKPAFEYQSEHSGSNPLGAVPLVPFINRARMVRHPLPEYAPAIPVQKRINKTLLDRMSMQDAGAFKAKWATGVDIPEDPETGKPVEPFSTAIDRLFIGEKEGAKFGQFEAEDIKQILEAVKDDVTHASVLVPTPPDQILGAMVNVSADGLESAKGSLLTRVRRHMRHDEESLEEIARLGLIGAGKDVPNARAMSTVWRNPEFRTDGERSDAATKAIANGVPHEAVWERYYDATPAEVTDWMAKMQARQMDPFAAAVLKGLPGGDPNAGAGA